MTSKRIGLKRARETREDDPRQTSESEKNCANSIRRSRGRSAAEPEADQRRQEEREWKKEGVDEKRLIKSGRRVGGLRQIRED
jgi:hypothetical protein